MAAAPSLDKVWLCERYARYKQQGNSSTLSQEANSTWEQLVSQDGGGPLIHLALVEGNHLTVTRGDQILENFILWNTQKWIKCFQKGDSLLFIYHIQNRNRRFRLKLAPGNKRSSVENCAEVASHLCKLMPLQNLSETLMATKTSTSPDEITIKEITQNLLNSTRTLDRVYANTHLPISQLPHFIRLCMTDSNFPDFVEAVEKELNAL